MLRTSSLKHSLSLIPALSLLLILALTSCDNTKSYAELLTDEDQATNYFLVNQKVLTSIPADTVFEVGVDAPYYQLDEDGNVYMQVLDAGTPGNKADYDQLIYFRFTRYSIYGYSYTAGDTNQGGYFGKFANGDGNSSDMTVGNASFRFENMEASSSYQWGSGVQLPLRYLPIDCVVNLVVKSQFGLTSEIAYVTPYFYANLRYFKSQI